jgi:hypothetical protein
MSRDDSGCFVRVERKDASCTGTHDCVTKLGPSLASIELNNTRQHRQVIGPENLRAVDGSIRVLESVDTKAMKRPKGTFIRSPHARSLSGSSLQAHPTYMTAKDKIPGGVSALVQGGDGSVSW